MPVQVPSQTILQVMPPVVAGQPLEQNMPQTTQRVGATGMFCLSLTPITGALTTAISAMSFIGAAGKGPMAVCEEYQGRLRCNESEFKNAILLGSLFATMSLLILGVTAYGIVLLSKRKLAVGTPQQASAPLARHDLESAQVAPGTLDGPAVVEMALRNPEHASSSDWFRTVSGVVDGVISIRSPNTRRAAA